MECDREKVWSNSPGVKEDVLPCAEIFSRDAEEEEEDLVTLPNHTLLLRLSVTPRKDVIVDPASVTWEIVHSAMEGPCTG